jgi:hypothetical protein
MCKPDQIERLSIRSRQLYYLFGYKIKPYHHVEIGSTVNNTDYYTEVNSPSKEKEAIKLQFGKGFEEQLIKVLTALQKGRVKKMAIYTKG